MISQYFGAPLHLAPVPVVLMDLKTFKSEVPPIAPPK